MSKGSRKKQPAKPPVQKNQPKNRGAILALIGGITVLVLSAVIGFSIYKSQSSTPAADIKGAAESAALLEGIPQQNNVLGQANAPVTLYIYEDLKCPTCQKFAINTLPQIINDYVRSGKLRLVFQIQSFVGRQSTPGDSERGARFALAVGKQNKMWNFTDLFYHNQPPESQRYFTDDFLTSLGREIAGLDVEKAFSETDSAQVTRELSEQLGAFRAAGFDGVPSFQIGKTGQLPTALTPSLDYSKFKSAIDNLL